MRILNWAMGLVGQLVGWVIRPRNLGVSLLSRSSTFLLVMGSGVTIEAQGVAGLVDAFKYAPADGLPGNLLTIVVYLACATWMIGLLMVLWTQYREWKEADTRGAFKCRQLSSQLPLSQPPSLSQPNLKGQHDSATADEKALPPHC